MSIIMEAFYQWSRNICREKLSNRATLATTSEDTVGRRSFRVSPATPLTKGIFVRERDRSHQATAIGDAPWRGALLMIATVTLQPVNQAVAKHLAAELPVIEIVWGRLLFHCLIAVPFVIASHGVGGLRPANPGIQIFRGGLLSVATIFLFGALAQIPMADAIALAFVAPLVVTALSPLLLGEYVGPRRWVAVAVGFAGALIVIRPGAGAMEWAALLALGSGVIYGFYLIVTRRIAGTAPPAVTLVYTALVGVVVTSAMLPFLWVSPTSAAWAWMALAGAASALAHFCLIRAYHYAEASLIAPLTYGEIVMATLLGYIVFGDFPDTVTWLGVGVIAMTGLYVSMRGRQDKADRSCR